MIKSILFATATALPLLLTAGAQAATVSATVADDRTIEQRGGVADSLRVQNDFYLRTFGVTSIWRSAIEFDLSGVTAGSTVTAATLSLSDQGSSTDGRIDVYGYTADGVITLADASETGNLVSDFTVTGSNGAENYSMDVTGFLDTLVGANAGFAGFLLVSSDETTSSVGGSDICSSEASNGTGTFSSMICLGLGPALDITFEPTTTPVPLPASLPVLLAGFGMLAYMKRRKG